MNKMFVALAIMGISVAGLNAGTVKCKFPVIKCEPVWKTVIKKIPHQECWEEVQKNPIQYKPSQLCQAGGVVVAKKCVLTKCKTVYTSIEEKVLVGYKNYAKCGCNTFYKVSNCKLKFIDTTINY